DTSRRTDGIDPFFVFDYVPLDGPDDRPPDPGDEPDQSSGQRMTTYWDVEKGCRGPDPRPAWVVTDAGAVDTELGVLKTGKEADASPPRRPAPHGTASLYAATRYRSPEHRPFHRSAAYTTDRRVTRSRDTGALERKSAHGRAIAAGQWAMAEWDALCRYWTVGLPV